MLSLTQNSVVGQESTSRFDQRRNFVCIVVLSGISLFVLLYIVAAFYYPGGSNADSTTPGFNLLTNYWCDLLGSQAKNSQPNPARPIAVAAMLLLSLTLAFFWYVTPPLFGFVGRQKRGLQVAGVLSMAIAPFIMTPYHDAVIDLAGSLGVVALLGTLVGLYKRQAFRLFGFGIWCLLLCCLNRYLYQTPSLIDYLPAVQKITFFLFLLWFGLISLNFRRNTLIV